MVSLWLQSVPSQTAKLVYNNNNWVYGWYIYTSSIVYSGGVINQLVTGVYSSNT